MLRYVWMFWGLCMVYNVFVDVQASYKVKLMNLIDNNGTSNSNDECLNSKYLIGSIDKYSGIVEKSDDRMLWNNLFNMSNDKNLILDNGIYQFAHRNYANYEEKYALCKKSYSIHKFLFRLDGFSKIRIYENDIVSITDNFVLFSIFPIRIQWFGVLNSEKNKITWKQTKISHRFGTIINSKNLRSVINSSWTVANIFDNIVIFRLYGNKKIAFYKIT